MSLARAWRRQLYGASSVALIVPSAMLAALLVLALGGGFGQVGVLGQIFGGPPAPSVGGGLALGGGAGVALGGGAGAAAPSLPVVARVGPRRAPGGHSRAGHGAVSVPVRSGSRGSGGALAVVGGVAPTVAATGAPKPARPAPAGSGPTASAPSPPAPQPSVKPTVVDRVIKVVSPVTQPLPTPAGPAVTQVVQTAGSAGDGVLPPGVGSKLQ
jgi:hypothetical protein